MLDDILEESWTYQEIVKKGLEKGRRQGLEQGRQQLIRELRDTVIGLVSMRFPMLLVLAESHIETIKSTEALHTLKRQLFSVQTAEEARQSIIDASTEETAE